jgi:phosphatidylserine decarboxylase
MVAARALRRPVAAPGLKGSGLLALLALCMVPLPGPWGPLLSSLLLAIAGANLLFFRNPSRVPPPGEGRIVSPADGRVVEVASVEDPEGFVGPAWRVAVFLSLLDGHVQRAPIAGKVRAVRRRGGEFLAAFRPEASERNASTRIDLDAASGARIAVVQIAGIIARRILCYTGAGDDLGRGEPYGLICYGSRVELYVPAAASLGVRPGDRVRAGETVVAEVRDAGG